VSLTSELLDRWAPIMRAVELVSSAHGTFDVYLDGRRLFSKKAAGRFPKPGEVAGLFEKTLGPALEWRGKAT
jgi:predicted Rdx family selenoprotein